MAVAILFHKFNVLCLLAFSALLHCLSCFNSYPRMMLINVVGSVSVLRASYAVICTWLWYFLKVKCKKRKSHLVWKNLRYNANIFVHKVSPNEINQQMTRRVIYFPNTPGWKYLDLRCEVIKLYLLAKGVNLISKLTSG